MLESGSYILYIFYIFQQDPIFPIFFIILGIFSYIFSLFGVKVFFLGRIFLKGAVCQLFVSCLSCISAVHIFFSDVPSEICNRRTDQSTLTSLEGFHPSL